MKLTRIIALAIIAGSLSSQSGFAQSSRGASALAEVPPASFKGRQYVDSRGCVYIRAGIDGAVNWVPRVERNRRQICGYEPTNIAGSTAPVRRATASAGPELITLPSADQPSAQTAAQPAVQTPVKTPPAVVSRQKPRRVAPAPVVKPVVKPAPVRVERQPVRRAVPVVVTPDPQPVPIGPGGCRGLSDISRQYTNQTDVRCGPQVESPVTYGQRSSLQLAPNTRVLPAHLHTARQQAADVEVPEGYRVVWQDGRLNPRRAEQALYPGGFASDGQPPVGYVATPNSIDRHNPQRAVGTATGAGTMARVWTNDLPRSLKPVVAEPVITVKNRYQTQPQRLGFLSAEASAALNQPSRYIRAGVFETDAAAASAKARLQARGLKVRMGRVTRKGQTYPVVLVGPFAGNDADNALQHVRAAGFSRARLSK